MSDREFVAAVKNSLIAADIAGSALVRKIDDDQGCCRLDRRVVPLLPRRANSWNKWCATVSMDANCVRFKHRSQLPPRR